MEELDKMAYWLSACLMDTNQVMFYLILSTTQ